MPNRYGGRENLEAIEFIKKFNTKVHERHPDVLTIAEESTAYAGVTHPVAEGDIENLHEGLADIAFDPFVENSDEKTAVFLGLHRPVCDQIAV